MPGPRSRARIKRPVEYRDRQGRVWAVSNVARLKVVSAAIDGPNHFLVIRFEREGEERFARWIGDPLSWRGRQALHRLFKEAVTREDAMRVYRREAGGPDCVGLFAAVDDAPDVGALEAIRQLARQCFSGQELEALVEARERELADQGRR